MSENESPELIALRAEVAALTKPESPELIALRAEVAALTKKLTASSSDIVQRHCNVCGADVPEGKCPAHPTDAVHLIATDPATKRPIIASRIV